MGRGRPRKRRNEDYNIGEETDDDGIDRQLREGIPNDSKKEIKWLFTEDHYPEAALIELHGMISNV